MAYKSVSDIIITFILLQLVWLVSGAVYRLFFHPLSKIPGPKLAAVTFWYEIFYDIVRPGRFVFKIQELHKQYGPIVRITPREVHINDAGFLGTIYPSSIHQKREKDWFQSQKLDASFSTGSTADHTLHRRRREALNPFFSQRSVLELEPMIKERVHQLRDVLDSNAGSRSSVNLSDLFYALSRDIIIEYSFGRNSNYLKDPAAASKLRNNLTRLMLGIKINLHFPWVNKATRVMPNFISKRLVRPGVIEMIELGKTISHEISQILDDKDNSMKTEKRSIFYELRDNPTLDPFEKSFRRLQSEGMLLVMAGTESTAKTMSVTAFHLFNNRKILEVLRAELQECASGSISELEKLPYLSACIQEGNRLAFGLTGRNSRIAPEETLQYKQFTLPAGTPMSETTLSIHTDESIFPDPWKFSPERWLGIEGMERRKYNYGFGQGSRKCVGMNLANAELFLVIAAIAQYDMDLFETDEGDVKFQHDYQVAHPKLDSEGIRVLVQGQMSSNVSTEVA